MRQIDNNKELVLMLRETPVSGICSSIEISWTWNRQAAMTLMTLRAQARDSPPYWQILARSGELTWGWTLYSSVQCIIHLLYAYSVKYFTVYYSIVYSTYGTIDKIILKFFLSNFHLRLIHITQFINILFHQINLTPKPERKLKKWNPSLHFCIVLDCNT